jgi:hypothetical protein
LTPAHGGLKKRKTLVKKLTLTLIATLITASSQLTHAMNYSATNTDMLLVFRQDNFSDVAFDLGSVSNLLALPNGTTTNLNYDKTQVKTNFNNTYTGVKFILVAATDSTAASGRFWSGALTSITASNLSGSQFGIVRGKIEAVGNNATAVTVSNAASFIDAPSDANSYTYVVTDATGTGVSTMNGAMKFTCEADAGSAMNVWEVAPSATTPKPKAKQIGSLTMNATTGIITYTSGTNAAVVLTAARIVSVIRTNTIARVNFATTNGNNYRLLFSTNLTMWQTNTGVGSIAGNNATNTFLDTNAAGRVFYRILSY